MTFMGECPGSPVVRSLHFDRGGPRFNLWSGKIRSHKLCMARSKKKKRGWGGVCVD